MLQLAILDEAKDMGLQTIEITHSNSSYPKNLGDWGVIGFNNMEEAESFRDKSGGEVGEFYKKDGWDLWNYGGVKNKSYNYQYYLNKLGDDYSKATKSDNDYYVERIAEMAKRSIEDLEYLIKMVESIKEIIEKLEDADEDEVVIRYGINYYETVQREMMIFSEDSKTYCIGVFLTKKDIDNYEES